MGLAATRNSEIRALRQCTVVQFRHRDPNAKRLNSAHLREATKNQWEVDYNAALTSAGASNGL